MKKLALALTLATLAFTGTSAWSQAASRAEVKADTAAAAKKGAISPSTEVDPENQKSENPPAKAATPKHRMKKSANAASAAK